MTAASETLLPPLTDEHRMLRDTVRDFAQREIAPVAAQLDETGRVPAGKPCGAWARWG